MSIFREILVVLVCAVMCTCMTSCRRPKTQMVEEKQGTHGPEGQPKGGGKNVLSREEIIRTANAEARRQGFDPETHTVFYDEGNCHWRTRAGPARPVTREDAEAEILDRWPELKGYDYQAVEYMVPRVPKRGLISLARPLYVLVDRNTGEVLLAVVFAS
jgi:hypothetical protein